jgi:hypothetical protein
MSANLLEPVLKKLDFSQKPVACFEARLSTLIIDNRPIPTPEKMNPSRFILQVVHNQGLT